ncbi:MAG: peptidylprolyl isomerase [Rhodobiaceae bacterium]|nr:peptidylprolyl isomerase [Rhodobiaceae bacterium]
MTTIYRNASLNELGIAPQKVPPQARPLMDPISVNGVEIREEDILSEAQNHPAVAPGEAVRSAARALVVAELLSQEAARQDILVAPETDDEGRRETERDAAIRGLLDREISVPAADDTTCRRYYENNLAKFRSAPLYEARHILLTVPPGDETADRQAKEAAASISDRIKSDPTLFSELALRHSACPSRQQYGSLGQLAPGSTVAEFEAALETMTTGEISGPVRSRFGYHVIALDRKIEPRQLPYEIVAERVAAWLEASSWSKAVAQYIAILAASADVRGIDMDTADGPLVQ